MSKCAGWFEPLLDEHLSTKVISGLMLLSPVHGTRVSASGPGQSSICYEFLIVLIARIVKKARTGIMLVSS